MLFSYNGINDDPSVIKQRCYFAQTLNNAFNVLLARSQPCIKVNLASI